MRLERRVSGRRRRLPRQGPTVPSPPSRGATGGHDALCAASVATLFFYGKILGEEFRCAPQPRPFGGEGRLSRKSTPATRREFGVGRPGICALRSLVRLGVSVPEAFRALGPRLAVGLTSAWRGEVRRSSSGVHSAEAAAQAAEGRGRGRFSREVGDCEGTQVQNEA